MLQKRDNEIPQWSERAIEQWSDEASDGAMTHQSLLFERDRRLAGLVVGDAARLILVLVVAVSRMRRRPGGRRARAGDTHVTYVYKRDTYTRAARICMKTVRPYNTESECAGDTSHTAAVAKLHLQTATSTHTCISCSVAQK